MKKTFIKYFWGILFLALPFASITAQDVISTTEVDREAPFVRNQIAQEGTFVFVKISKIQEVFTTEQYEQIKILVAQNRDAVTEKRINISIYSDVIIPPASAINHPDFVPFTTLFLE